jgi:hypothetical protein
MKHNPEELGRQMPAKVDKINDSIFMQSITHKGFTYEWIRAKIDEIFLY